MTEPLSFTNDHHRPSPFLDGAIGINPLEQKNTELIKEFNRSVREHPDFAERIPDGAMVILQLEGDDAFNAWARQLAEVRRAERSPLVFVKIKKLTPLRSRIEQLELEEVANA